MGGCEVRRGIWEGVRCKVYEEERIEGEGGGVRR